LDAGTISSARDLELFDGGELKGNGSIDLSSESVGSSTLTVTRGTISPGFSIGHLDIDGDLDVTSGGKLYMEIESELERDTIEVTGEATLGGVLTINIPDDMPFQNGDKAVLGTADNFVVESSFSVNVTGDLRKSVAVYIEEDSFGIEKLIGEEVDPGDMDCSGEITRADIPLFALALRNPEAYIQKMIEDEEIRVDPNSIGNVDGLGKLDFDDIDDLARKLKITPPALLSFMSGIQNVPEPTSGVLLMLLANVMLVSRSRIRHRPR
jgi:hypothetical protein